MKNLYCLIIFLNALLLGGCGKSVVSGSATAKSLDYFSAHIDDAKATSEKCRVFFTGEYSALSPNAQSTWQKTADGVNCRNANQAVFFWTRAELDRKMHEENERVFAKFRK